MALINVNRSNPDVFYRYKMPKLIAKVEGKGNGIKTVICNMSDIGKALYRPATYPTKFFGCELGAQTTFDHKRDRYIVNGSHEAEKLQDLLDGFIKKFVLCPECENPETVFSVHTKAQTIGQSCRACGYSGKLDMRHKLTTFILKNPPESPQEGGVKKKSKKGESTGGEEGDSPDENGASESQQPSKNGVYDNEEDIDWGEDVSEEAQQKRMLELSSAAASLAVTADLEKTPQERADLFFKYVKTKKAESGDGKLSPSYRLIVAEAERLEMKDKAVLILAELLLSADILKDLKDHRALFLSFTGENDKAQKYLLGAFEKLVGTEFHDQLIGKTAVILKTMYDLDLVDEETFLEWGKKVSRKYVNKEVGQEIHAKAEPFLKWLKEAEEEDSEDEESEGDIGVEFTNTAKVGMKDTAQPAASNNGADEKTEEDSDIDLDDI
ncbi:eukaryotic translation initiation factor 5-like [Watersipora subatra]|uniref:eukaryotic translation initiation factor 5-like n=1 Tax=Watersipora subatra TaxID=2589382 RepID=UPI00355B8C3C